MESEFWNAIKATITNYIVKRILMDSGNAIEVYDAFATNEIEWVLLFQNFKITAKVILNPTIDFINFSEKLTLKISFQFFFSSVQQVLSNLRVSWSNLSSRAYSRSNQLFQFSLNNIYYDTFFVFKK